MRNLERVEGLLQVRSSERVEGGGNHYPLQRQVAPFSPLDLSASGAQTGDEGVQNHHPLDSQHKAQRHQALQMKGRAHEWKMPTRKMNYSHQRGHGNEHENENKRESAHDGA